MSGPMAAVPDEQINVPTARGRTSAQIAPVAPADQLADDDLDMPVADRRRRGQTTAPPADHLEPEHYAKTRRMSGFPVARMPGRMTPSIATEHVHDAPVARGRASGAIAGAAHGAVPEPIDTPVARVRARMTPSAHPGDMQTTGVPEPIDTPTPGRVRARLTPTAPGDAPVAGMRARLTPAEYTDLPAASGRMAGQMTAAAPGRSRMVIPAAPGRATSQVSPAAFGAPRATPMGTPPPPPVGTLVAGDRSLSPAVSGLLRLRGRTGQMPAVDPEDIASDVEGDEAWAKEILAATTRGGES